MSQIRVKNVSYSYKTRTAEIKALSGLSLSIEKGTFCALIGSNGSGKSTLAKLLNGLCLPDDGKVYINDLDSSDKNNIFKIRETVGLVFQNPDNQIIGDTVEDDVAFGPENLGLSCEEIDRTVSEALSKTGIENLRHRNPLKLSGGQKQRVAIAGVLAMGSDCLVLDEATSMLDPASRKEVLENLHELNRKHKTTVVLITHHTQECLDCDQVFVMDKGRLVLQGSPREVFSEYELLKSLNLAVPAATELAHELGLKPGILTETELEEELRRIRNA